MTEEEYQFKRKINLDKAFKKTNSALVIIILSLASYIFAYFMAGEYDFGVIFEVIVEYH